MRDVFEPMPVKENRYTENPMVKYRDKMVMRQFVGNSLHGSSKKIPCNQMTLSFTHHRTALYNCANAIHPSNAQERFRWILFSHYQDNDRIDPAACRNCMERSQSTSPIVPLTSGVNVRSDDDRSCGNAPQQHPPWFAVKMEWTPVLHS